MGQPQSFYPADLDDMVAWVRGVAPPGARVLEIGCGDGAIVRRLRAEGVDAVGVDPRATAEAGIIAAPFEDLDAAPFDVIFASVALHHLPDPVRAAVGLRRLAHAGTQIVVREFDRELMDHEPTMRWWFHQRHALEAVGVRDGDHEMPPDFDTFMAGWRAKMAEHVQPWSIVAGMLADAGFGTESLSVGPYLFRWGLTESLRPVEEALIADGRIHAVGVRWHGHHRG